MKLYDKTSSDHGAKSFSFLSFQDNKCYLHLQYKIITKVPKPFKIRRSRIRELVNSPKDSGPNSSFKSEPQLRFNNCRLIQGCQKRMILIVLDQVAIHGFKLRPDFIDKQFLHHCILTDQNLLIYLRYLERKGLVLSRLF